MSFSTGLQAKIGGTMLAGSITPLANNASVPTWTETVSATVATANNTGVLYQTNAFGTYPGVKFSPGFPPTTMQLAADLPGVRAVFALVKADNTTVVGPIGSYGFVVGDSADSLRGGSDSQLWLEARTGNNALLAAYEDGQGVGLALNRRSYPSVIGATFPSTSIRNIGGYTFGSCGATIGGLIFLIALPSPSEIIELQNYLSSLGSIAPVAHPTKAILYFGDSLTSQDAGSTPVDFNSTYPSLVSRMREAALGGNIAWQNLAYFGDNASGCKNIIQVRGVATVQALAGSGYTDVTCIVDIGRNDIYNGADPSTTAANIQQSLDSLKTAGATNVVICTLMASIANSGQDQATCDANRATLNASLVAMVPAHANKVARIDLDSGLGPNGAQTNANFVSDHIHLTAAGITRQANVVYPLTVIDTTPPAIPTNLIVKAGDGHALIQFTANTDDTANYVVTRNGVELTDLILEPDDDDNLYGVDRFLTNGTTYTYAVYAIDGAGNQSAATAGVAVTPYAPLSGDWHWSNSTGFQDQFGITNALVESDLDETTISNYLVRAGTIGDAYIDAVLRGMGLTLPLPALNASSMAWMQDISNHAARWKLKDARELWDAIGVSAADAAKYQIMDKKYVDDQLASLSSGDVVLVGADGTTIALADDREVGMRSVPIDFGDCPGVCDEFGCA